MIVKPWHCTLPGGLYLAAVFVLVHSTGQAHPGSHVDAWARIDTHLEIRVTMFLDNVIAWQKITDPADDSLIPAADALQALNHFDDTLRAMLTIYDADGRRLDARIADRPRWKPSAAGVDLAADAGLRLTWKLRYPWQKTHQSFSIRHRFVAHRSRQVPESVDLNTAAEAPCELRLRLRTSATARRIDTVIPDHQFHTILLPSETAAMRADLRLNQTPVCVRFELQPAVLIHEFSLPLPRAANGACTLDDITEVDGLRPIVELAVIRTQFENWAQRYLQLTVDGDRSVPGSVTVSLLTAGNKPIENSRTVPFIGTRVNVRTVHSVSRTPKQITVRWERAPRNVSQVRIDTLAGEATTTQLFDCRDESSGTDTLNYLWDPPKVGLPAAQEPLKPR